VKQRADGKQFGQVQSLYLALEIYSETHPKLADDNAEKISLSRQAI
jgi:hypothetical protein